MTEKQEQTLAFLHAKYPRLVNAQGEIKNETALENAMGTKKEMKSFPANGKEYYICSKLYDFNDFKTLSRLSKDAQFDGGATWVMQRCIELVNFLEKKKKQDIIKEIEDMNAGNVTYVMSTLYSVLDCLERIDETPALLLIATLFIRSDEYETWSIEFAHSVLDDWNIGMKEDWNMSRPEGDRLSVGFFLNLAKALAPNLLKNLKDYSQTSLNRQIKDLEIFKG